MSKEQTGAEVAFGRLVEIMRRLRAPGGCPWDREQDFRSLRRYVLEEAYEVVQAIDDDDMEALESELGDLLLQIVFLSEMAVEGNHFDVENVITAISDKLVRRHPHVFGDLEVADSAEVLQRWEMIKLEERGGGSVLDDIPGALPGLARAEKLGRRAAQLGFDWPEPEDVVGKIREELAEVEDEMQAQKDAGHRRAPDVEAEIGDLLFAVANLARQLGLSPEVALRGANERFESRFRSIEPELAEAQGADLETMEALWDRAKRAESKAP